MVIKYQIWYFIGQYVFDICVKTASEKFTVVKPDIPRGFEFEKYKNNMSGKKTGSKLL